MSDLSPLLFFFIAGASWAAICGTALWVERRWPQ
jgi:hypothetical protein